MWLDFQRMYLEIKDGWMKRVFYTGEEVTTTIIITTTTSSSSETVRLFLLYFFVYLLIIWTFSWPPLLEEREGGGRYIPTTEFHGRTFVSDPAVVCGLDGRRSRTRRVGGIDTRYVNTTNI